MQFPAAFVKPRSVRAYVESLLPLTVWESGVGDMNLPSRPISVIYELLADFPEEVAPRAVARLPFVQDAALRESIGRDVDSMEPLIRSEQWKAATVIGGSAIEAILLDALGGREAEARQYARQQALVDPRPWRIGPLLKWDLWQLIAVSRHLDILDDAAEGMCDAAREYRNLIHPGVVERTNNKASLATALNARAAVESLLERLAGGYPPAPAPGAAPGPTQARSFPPCGMTDNT